MTSQFPQYTEKRFADYFVVCGLDPTSGLEPDQLAGDSLHCTPLDRPYRSKVLAHYPENVPWNPFDFSAVGMLCLPRGLRFRTQKHSRDPHFHPFIITREDGSRMFGHALTFYEEVMDHQICGAMQTLQAMHLTELSSSKAQIGHLTDAGSTRSLPRSFKLNSRHAANKGLLYDMGRDTLYATKCICLITPLPMILASQRFLQGLHNIITSDEPPPLPLESYIYNILYEVPLPMPGRTIHFMCFGERLLCQRPGSSELPLFEYSYKKLFLTLGVENVILLLTSVMLENQILISSDDYFKLMCVAECITMLLFPFTWQHVYVPILPASLHHFLDAPVPYIMGLLRGSDETSHPVPGEANLCFVDVENKLVQVPDDMPKFPYKAEVATEIVETLSRFGVSLPSNGLDRNQNERRSLGQMRHVRKLSWTEEVPDSGLSSWESTTRSSHGSVSSVHAHILQQSEALQKITAIAKRTGIINSLEDLRTPRKVDAECNHAPVRQPEGFQQRLDELRPNNAVREIFLKRFIRMLSSYDHYIIQPSQDMEKWFSSRETMQNFDKTAFLCDQPEPHLPFLSCFIETQMFASLIDNKIMSQWEGPDPYLKVFDARIRLFKENQPSDLDRLPCYETFGTFKDTEPPLEEQRAIGEGIAPSPKTLDISPELLGRRKYDLRIFPVLDSSVLNQEPTYSKYKKRTNALWRRQGRQQRHYEHLRPSVEQREKFIQEARNKTVRHPKLADVSAAAIAQTNWEFVEALLKECTMRTKRMLVEKMGQEAVELGHSEVNIMGLEENTLIASLCDLLERIWNHGLQVKQGKSSLWSHLLSYLEVEECKTTGKPIDPNFLTPDISTLSLDNGSPEEKHEPWQRRKAHEVPTLRPLHPSLISDIKHIQAMTEVKTDIGYARAWVRLALERKMLSKHLKKLLSNQKLLKSHYRRYAFLRCDDEKEQFLYHLLTLNAVDYFCFTNTFTSLVMPYRAVIFPSRKSGASSTSANAWIIVSGTLGETGTVNLPKDSLDIIFQHKNLGILTTLRIGHDNSGSSAKWMVEHVLVRNEVTGHIYKFPCGRWLGKGIDDDSTERLLVGELVPPDTDSEELVETCRTPPRCRSPSVPRRASEPKLTVPEIQQLLGNAVNNIVKYFYKPERERGNLTILLCGELGLVYCLEQVFLYGFKATRFFRHVYLWDFFAKVRTYFETVLHEEPIRPSISQSWDTLEHVVVMRSFCQLVDKIDTASHSVGKDGKFQLFVCIAARDHLLYRMLMHIASTPVTAGMYEEQSFLRDPNLVTFLVQILESLSEFTITLEASLTKGIER